MGVLCSFTVSLPFSSWRGATCSLFVIKKTLWGWLKWLKWPSLFCLVIRIVQNSINVYNTNPKWMFYWNYYHNRNWVSSARYITAFVFLHTYLQFSNCHRWIAGLGGWLAWPQRAFLMCLPCESPQKPRNIPAWHVPGHPCAACSTSMPLSGEASLMGV